MLFTLQVKSIIIVYSACNVKSLCTCTCVCRDTMMMSVIRLLAMKSCLLLHDLTSTSGEPAIAKKYSAKPSSNKTSAYDPPSANLPSTSSSTSSPSAKPVPTPDPTNSDSFQVGRYRTTLNRHLLNCSTLCVYSSTGSFFWLVKFSNRGTLLNKHTCVNWRWWKWVLSSQLLVCCSIIRTPIVSN